MFRTIIRTARLCTILGTLALLPASSAPILVSSGFQFAVSERSGSFFEATLSGSSLIADPTTLQTGGFAGLGGNVGLGYNEPLTEFVGISFDFSGVSAGPFLTFLGSGTPTTAITNTAIAGLIGVKSYSFSLQSTTPVPQQCSDAGCVEPYNRLVFDLTAIQDFQDPGNTVPEPGTGFAGLVAFAIALVAVAKPKWPVLYSRLLARRSAAS